MLPGLRSSHLRPKPEDQNPKLECNARIPRLLEAFEGVLPVFFTWGSSWVQSSNAASAQAPVALPHAADLVMCLGRDTSKSPVVHVVSCCAYR